MDVLQVFIGCWQMLLPSSFLDGEVDFLRTYFVIYVTFNVVDMRLIKVLETCQSGGFGLVCSLCPWTISISCNIWHKI